MNKPKLDRFIAEYASFGARQLADKAHSERTHGDHILSGFHPITYDDLLDLTVEHAPKYEYDDPDSGRPQFDPFGFARDLFKGVSLLLEKKGKEPTYNIPTEVWIKAFGDVSMEEVEHELKKLRMAHRPWWETEFRKEVTDHVMNNVDSLSDVDTAEHAQTLLNRFLFGFDSIFRKYLTGKFPGWPSHDIKP